MNWDLFRAPAFWPLATSALGAGVVAALTNQGIVWLKEARRTKAEHAREQRHVALTVAVVLECYALECAQCISDALDAEAEAGRTFSPDPLRSISMPTLTLPADTNWRWIPAELAARVLGLPLQVDYSRAYIRGASEYGDPFGSVAEIRTQAARRGTEAWRLAELLRKAVHLPDSTLDTEPWDFRATLAEALPKTKDAP